MADGTIAVLLKTCTKCGVAQDATTENFSPLKAGVYGLQTWCKPCCAAYRREYRARHPDRVAASKREYYARPEAQEIKRSYQQRYWQDNRERLIEGQHARYAERGVEYNARKRQRIATDAEYRQRVIARNKRWKEADPDRARALRRAWWGRRTPTQKLRYKLSVAIRDSLNGRRKGAGWQTLVGYTAADLRVHLERQFVKGMTWENYGTGWHIDHIVPVASFKITSDHCPEFKACWALTNLRPLWAEANLKKRAKRLYLL